VTVYTQIGLLYRRRVIPLVVKAAGSFQHTPWAIIDAVAAPLAPVLYDVDHPPGYDYLAAIEGNTPKFHLLSSANIVCALLSLSYQVILKASQDK
jgi:hypothetical protein